MTRFYSLFVSSDEQLASPYIRRFASLHDISLRLGTEEKVHFLLQTKLQQKQKADLEVIFDETQIDVHSIDVDVFQHQTLITARITPKELGMLRIGFTYPETNRRSLPRRLLSKHSPLTHRSWQLFRPTAN